jgi:hypothetical protein
VRDRCLDRDPLRRLGIVADPGLVELDDVGAGGHEVVRLLFTAAARSITISSSSA